MMFLRNVCAAYFVHKIYFITNILGNYLLVIQGLAHPYITYVKNKTER